MPAREGSSLQVPADLPRSSGCIRLGLCRQDAYRPRMPSEKRCYSSAPSGSELLRPAVPAVIRARSDMHLPQATNRELEIAKQKADVRGNSEQLPFQQPAYKAEERVSETAPELF